MDLAGLRALIRDVPDFPAPGIVFKDLTPLQADPDAFATLIELLAAAAEPASPEIIVGIEARGFVLAAPVAVALGAGFVPARKEGKLPSQTHAQDYVLEYATATLEIPRDGLAGRRVVVIDDVLATGGTMAAAAALVQRAGGQVQQVLCALELEALGGRARLLDHDVRSILQHPAADDRRAEAQD